MQHVYLVLAIIIGLFVLSLLVFIHELGHFLAAKACKIRVLAFAIGFGKALFTWKRGDTEYRVNAIPFGGYVQMAGDSPDNAGSGADDEYNSKPIWQRATVALAGPIANFIFAVFTLWVAFVYGIDRPAFMDSSKIGIVMKGSPAEAAGFAAGDSIVSINGDAISAWDQVDARLAQQLDNYDITVSRGGEPMSLSLHVEKTGARLPTMPTGGLLPARYPPVVGGILPKGSAEKTLQVGDTLVALNGTAVSSFDRFAMLMREYDPDGGPADIDIKRGSETMKVLIIPTYDSAAGRYLLGIEPAPEPTKLVRYGAFAAIGPTMGKTWEYSMMIFDVLAKLTSGKVSAKQLAGPLNIIPVSGMMAFQGLSNILNFMALIGINLAVLNLLPLVITDGGLLMFLIIEAIRKKPLTMQTQMAINKAFIVLFLALFLFVSFNDVQRLPDLLRWWR
ncbi:MAG: RIP metalloprotease RseP [Chitinispirillales bacterium]|jgi:regulator of sigma E protease|nr:RIP metalloprotease RseP [Chitinispirillales bacterium]